MKGVLRSGKAISVKKIFYAHLLGNVENEIICLTEVSHQNVIQLVGYCVETKSEVVELCGKHVMTEKCACLHVCSALNFFVMEALISTFLVC
jgi:hypothetical protein